MPGSSSTVLGEQGLRMTLGHGRPLWITKKTHLFTITCHRDMLDLPNEAPELDDIYRQLLF